MQRESAPDAKDLEEVRALNREKIKLENKNENLLISLRETYGRNIIRFLWVYFIFTALAIFISAFSLKAFNIPQPVLVALVGGTAVSVLGVVGTVAAGLFRPK